jgi:hypothetical protein
VCAGDLQWLLSVAVAEAYPQGLASAGEPQRLTYGLVGERVGLEGRQVVMGIDVGRAVGGDP